MTDKPSVDDICALIGRDIGWAEGETPDVITPDTELLAMGLLDSLTIRRIVAGIADTYQITLPDNKIVAATFRTPEALWRVVTA